jgi:proteasome lid subunit RPN8/RPN11
MMKIETQVLDVIQEDATATFPDECCGFLFGHAKGSDKKVTAATIVNNAKEGDKRRRFEIGPKDYLHAERFAEENALQLLGVYHSHPNHPAIPSEHDRVAALPNFSYIIISVMDKEFAGLRSWLLNEASQFEEENIESN